MYVPRGVLVRVAGVAGVSYLSHSWLDALIMTTTMLAIEAAFAGGSLASQRGSPDGGGNQPSVELLHSRFFSLRFSDEWLEQSFSAQRFRDTEAVVLAFCAGQILLLLMINLAGTATTWLGVAAPYLMQSLAAVAIARLAVRRIGDAARAQSLFYWAWFAVVLSSCLLAIHRQTRAPREEEAQAAAGAAASRALGMSSIGVAAVLAAGTATYLRLFVIDVAPRLCILCCLVASDVIFVLAGATVTALEPSYAEPMVVIDALVVGDLLGRWLEHQQRLAFLATHEMAADVTSEAASPCSLHGRSQSAVSVSTMGSEATEDDARQAALRESPSPDDSFKSAVLQPEMDPTTLSQARVPSAEFIRRSGDKPSANDTRRWRSFDALSNSKVPVDPSGSDTPPRLRRSEPSSQRSTPQARATTSSLSCSLPELQLPLPELQLPQQLPIPGLASSSPASMPSDTDAAPPGRLRPSPLGSGPSASWDGPVPRESSRSGRSVHAREAPKDPWWREQARPRSAPESDILHRAAVRAAAAREVVRATAAREMPQHEDDESNDDVSSSKERSSSKEEEESRESNSGDDKRVGCRGRSRW